MFAPPRRATIPCVGLGLSGLALVLGFAIPLLWLLIPVFLILSLAGALARQERQGRDCRLVWHPDQPPRPAPGWGTDRPDGPPR